MTACPTCSGYGMRHDPIAHGAEPTEEALEWATARTLHTTITGHNEWVDGECVTCGGWNDEDDQKPDDETWREGPWHCICGSGDDGEWHTFMCAAHNTPDDVFFGEDDGDDR